MMYPPWYRTGHRSRPTIQTPPADVVYVNTATGSDGNSGTYASPFLTLTAAARAVEGWQDRTIRITASSANPIRTAATFETSMDVLLEGLDNEPWHARGSDVVSSFSGPSSNVYSKSIGFTLVTGVTVIGLTEEIGGVTYDLCLVENTSTPTTPGIGQFGYDSGTLYLRLPGDASPANYTIEVTKRGACVTTYGSGTLTVRDLDARGALTACVSVGLTGKSDGTGVLVLEDSFCGYSGGSGVAAQGQWETATCRQVDARRNTNDGFNWHTTSGLYPVARQFECLGIANGLQAGASAQGCSPHETAMMYVLGGEYSWNVSGGFVGIDDSYCELDGTTYGPVLMAHNMRLGNTAGTIAGQAGAAWMDSSTGRVRGSVVILNGQGVGVRVATADAVVGIEDITSTGNALPDVIA